MLFPRVARNFIKNGYFPTDEDTLARTLPALAPSPDGQMAILDPSAGEGVALAECKHHLGADRTTAYGIEIDKERAWHAKKLLNHAIHGDLMEAVIGKQRFGLLFLNPPYGDLAADKTHAQCIGIGRQRLEKLFYRQTIGTLQPGGVLVLIIPYKTLDEWFAETLARHLVRVQVFLAPEQRFKQIVLFGVRGQGAQDANHRATVRQLIAIGKGQLPPTLPVAWEQAPYQVPVSKNPNIPFGICTLDEQQLAAVIEQSPGLWEQFEQRFQQNSQFKQPLTDLSEWHLALALAAGQVTGHIQSKDGRQYLVCGSTYKAQEEKVSCEVSDDNEVTQTYERLDRFVPVLRALDMTPHSASYGRVQVIR